MIIPYYCEDYPEEELTPPPSFEDGRRESDKNHADAEQLLKKGNKDGSSVDCPHHDTNKKL